MLIRIILSFPRITILREGKPLIEIATEEEIEVTYYKEKEIWFFEPVLGRQYATLIVDSIKTTRYISQQLHSRDPCKSR